MRMSCSKWVTGGTSSSSSPPSRESLAYRRYLRFLPEYSGWRKDVPEDDENSDLGRDEDQVQKQGQGQGQVQDQGCRQNEEQGSHDQVQTAEDDQTGCEIQEFGDDNERRGSLKSAGQPSEWLQHTSDRIGTPPEVPDRKLEDDNMTDVVISVSSLVHQYNCMLRARTVASSTLQASRSCSSLAFVRTAEKPPAVISSGRRRSTSRQQSSQQNGSETPSHDSVDSGDGEGSYGPRYRSFSLPWPSDPSWRWTSDPNLAAMAAGYQTTPIVSGVGHSGTKHSSSLARLDSATSDEGCPRDGSTGPTPPPSPIFRGSGRRNHLHGLITPFKSLSPASSMGSQLGSVEDLPLARSMSLGHGLDHWVRSHSADSALEVEDEAVLPSPAHSPMNAHRQSIEKSVSDEGFALCDSHFQHPTNNNASDNDRCSGKCRLLHEKSKCGDGSALSQEDSDTNLVFRESESDGKHCEYDVSCMEGSEDVVELRRKVASVDPIDKLKRERRCGGVNGEVLLRRARGCGALTGSEVLDDTPSPDENPDRKVLRTPSVVISDHSGETISLTVALASSDFSLEQLDKFQHCSASGSTLGLMDDLASRKVSSCSSCSSLSTVDLTSSLSHMTLDSLREVPGRRISDCSLSSVLTVSEDEVEHILPRPPTPKKPSNWRKVRNIVQWTPFIQTYKKHKYPWVQLAGHQGNFRAGYKQGTILKKLCPAEERALEIIMKDIVRSYVPQYMGVVEGTDGERYLQLQDLLSDFELPCVMDIKMGVRTYLEDELAKAREKPKLRKDMYEKMIQIDPKAPTEAENKAKAVTKPRYMVWRETISSTATQGFRIEGVRRGDGSSSKDFKTTRTREQVLASLTSFLQGYSHAATRYVQQLKSIKVTLEASEFFNSHELIGSSLLFVHNDTSASVRLIDFAKTVPLPENVRITHRSPWSEGTHEDGYLLGLDNLIDLFSIIEKNLTANDTANKTAAKPTESEQTKSTSSTNNHTPS